MYVELGGGGDLAGVVWARATKRSWIVEVSSRIDLTDSLMIAVCILAVACQRQGNDNTLVCWNANSRICLALLDQQLRVDRELRGLTA
jgi:hypothetical protein